MFFHYVLKPIIKILIKDEKQVCLNASLIRIGEGKKSLSQSECRSHSDRASQKKHDPVLGYDIWNESGRTLP